MERKLPQIVRVLPGSEEKALRVAEDALERGRLIVLPTDTVYGVGAKPSVPGAEERLFEAKGRDRGKPVPLLAAGIEAVERFGAKLDGLARSLALRFWPGPLTLVLEVPGGHEGFRVPKHPLALALLRTCGGTLRVSSANLSGEPPALTAGAAEAALGGRVDVILDAGPSPGGVPSTVVRVERGELKIIREGAIAAAQLVAWSGTSVSGSRGEK